MARGDRDGLAGGGLRAHGEVQALQHLGGPGAQRGLYVALGVLDIPPHELHGEDAAPTAAAATATAVITAATAAAQVLQTRSNIVSQALRQRRVALTRREARLEVRAGSFMRRGAVTIIRQAASIVVLVAVAVSMGLHDVFTHQTVVSLVRSIQQDKYEI